MQPRRYDCTTMNQKMLFFVRSYFRGFVVSWFRGCLLAAAFALPAFAQSGKPTNYKGLEMSIAGVERAANASLKDCPPGGNTVTAITKPGEEFAVVKINFKVLPAFQRTTILKKPVLADASGKTYNTAVSFVDVGSVPEFSCAIPFRVPAGTALRSVQIDTASLDLTGAEAKK